VGYIARRYGFIDMPLTQRPRAEKTLEQKLHDRKLPRLGGLAVLIPFLIIFVTSAELNSQMWGIILGVLILMISGAIDDKFDLSSKQQFLFQVLAATITVITGTSITFIQVMGIEFDLNLFSKEIFLSDMIYNFVFPADLFTIFWIVTIINALNWVFGIDALGEGITIITAITIMFIAVKTGRPELAILPASLAASLLGYFPYNFPPSKIISGTIGTSSYGYLVAVLATISGAKISTAILLLTLPLFDMFWVIIYRLTHFKNVPLLKRPFQKGRIHLHHRLMNAGYTIKETVVIETSGMAVIAVLAYYLAGFGAKLLSVSIFMAIIAVIASITVLTSRKKRAQDRLKRIRAKKDVPPPTIEKDIPPEERYAY
jgi:UDP-GlcNAc:undecaprenyl-phosphate GlcNAc-1-phosphate transferase